MKSIYLFHLHIFMYLLIISWTCCLGTNTTCVIVIFWKRAKCVFNQRHVFNLYITNKMYFCYTSMCSLLFSSKKEKKICNICWHVGGFIFQRRRHLAVESDVKIRISKYWIFIHKRRYIYLNHNDVFFAGRQMISKTYTFIS